MEYCQQHRQWQGTRDQHGTLIFLVTF